MQMKCILSKKCPDSEVFSAFCDTVFYDDGSSVDSSSDDLLYFHLFGDSTTLSSIAADVVRKSSFGGNWIVALTNDMHFLPDGIDMYTLASSRQVRLESLGRPAVSGARIVVYRRMGTGQSIPDLPVLYGPGAASSDSASCSFRLWPRDRFDTVGKGLWSDDPTVQKAVYDSVRDSDSVPWIQPGFAFALPDKPVSLKAVDGRTFRGVLAASNEVAGGWVILDSEDLSVVFGLPQPVSYDQLFCAVGDHCIRTILGWIRSFPKRSAD